MGLPVRIQQSEAVTDTTSVPPLPLMVTDDEQLYGVGLLVGQEIVTVYHVVRVTVTGPEAGSKGTQLS